MRRDCVLRVSFAKSRMRESRTYGSVRAKAEWLRYSTNFQGPKLEPVMSYVVSLTDLRTAINLQASNSVRRLEIMLENYQQHPLRVAR
jgi:hypothetical protein